MASKILSVSKKSAMGIAVVNTLFETDSAPLFSDNAGTCKNQVGGEPRSKATQFVPMSPEK